MIKSQKTRELLKEVHHKGLNIYMMLGLFKKRSKLKPEIPEEVIDNVCGHYLNNKKTIEKDFPYFLAVLKSESSKYFAERNQKDHSEIKNSPSAFKNILKEILS